ncbi:MAG: hypothetical protein LN411_05755 [Candidatus Thermoplasmatota archaeon]|nr:hypothetical protein [Candidatus Thermoplasmatota archaeon]
MNQDDVEILREAARIRQRKEPLERAVGRAVRNKGKDYSYYIALMSELRNAASMADVSVDEEFRILVECEEDQG